LLSSAHQGLVIALAHGLHGGQAGHDALGNAVAFGADHVVQLFGNLGAAQALQVDPANVDHAGLDAGVHGLHVGAEGLGSQLNAVAHTAKDLCKLVFKAAVHCAGAAAVFAAVGDAKRLFLGVDFAVVAALEALALYVPQGLGVGVDAAAGDADFLADQCVEQG
jgi:hypothetical protein